MTESEVEANAACENEFAEKKMCVVMMPGHQGWYEEVNCSELVMGGDVGSGKATGFHALPLSKNIVREFVANISCTARVIYYCVHDPCHDPPILNLLREMRKMEKSICLVVVLPEFEHLCAYLRRQPQTELQEVTDRIRTMANFLAWLERFRSGMLVEWKVVFPYMRLEAVEKDALFAYLQQAWNMEVAL